MPDLISAYRRSAYPRLGITFEAASSTPALRTSLELLDKINAQQARRAVSCGAGKRLEVTCK